eukprot:g4633.t1
METWWLEQISELETAYRKSAETRKQEALAACEKESKIVLDIRNAWQEKARRKMRSVLRKVDESFVHFQQSTFRGVARSSSSSTECRTRSPAKQPTDRSSLSVTTTTIPRNDSKDDDDDDDEVVSGAKEGIPTKPASPVVPRRPSQEVLRNNGILVGEKFSTATANDDDGDTTSSSNGTVRAGAIVGQGSAPVSGAPVQETSTKNVDDGDTISSSNETARAGVIVGQGSSNVSGAPVQETSTKNVDDGDTTSGSNETARAGVIIGQGSTSVARLLSRDRTTEDVVESGCVVGSHVGSIVGDASTTTSIARTQTIATVNSTASIRHDSTPSKAKPLPPLPISPIRPDSAAVKDRTSRDDSALSSSSREERSDSIPLECVQVNIASYDGNKRFAVDVTVDTISWRLFRSMEEFKLLDAAHARACRKEGVRDVGRLPSFSFYNSNRTIRRRLNRFLVATVERIGPHEGVRSWLDISTRHLTAHIIDYESSSIFPSHDEEDEDELSRRRSAKKVSVDRQGGLPRVSGGSFCMRCCMCHRVWLIQHTTAGFCRLYLRLLSTWGRTHVPTLDVEQVRRATISKRRALLDVWCASLFRARTRDGVAAEGDPAIARFFGVTDERKKGV